MPDTTRIPSSTENTGQEHRLKCAEVWGGFTDVDTELSSAAVHASLFSSACEGGRGGDIYYLSVCRKDMLTRMVIADVMGHGPAVSSTSQALYAALLEHMNSDDGAAVLHDVNNAANELGFKAITTAAMLAVYTEDDQVRFSYAGHHPALIRRAGSRSWEELALDESALRATNLPLAIDEGTTYDQQHGRMNKGDQMLLYTDGVIEAMNTEGVQLGVRALLDALNELPEGAAVSAVRRNAVSTVRQHVGGALDHDDLTILVAEVRT